MKKTSNYIKHNTNNPIARFFLNQFSHTLISCVRSLGVKSVLDVGCGEGFVLKQLSREHIGTRLEGVDISKEAIEIGKKEHPGLMLSKKSIYELPYPDSAFDLVLCIEVLEHLENPQRGLKEIVRVAKKYLLLSVPNEPFFTLQRILRGRNLFDFGIHPEHLQKWTSKEFEKFVLQGEVKVVLKKHPFPWTMLLLEKKDNSSD